MTWDITKEQTTEFDRVRSEATEHVLAMARQMGLAMEQPLSWRIVREFGAVAAERRREAKAAQANAQAALGREQHGLNKHAMTYGPQSEKTLPWRRSRDAASERVAKTEAAANRWAHLAAALEYLATAYERTQTVGLPPGMGPGHVMDGQIAAAKRVLHCNLSGEPVSTIYDAATTA